VVSLGTNLSGDAMKRGAALYQLKLNTSSVKYLYREGTVAPGIDPLVVIRA